MEMQIARFACGRLKFIKLKGLISIFFSASALFINVVPYEDPVIFFLSRRLLTNLLINMEMENQLLFQLQRAASLRGV